MRGWEEFAERELAFRWGGNRFHQCVEEDCHGFRFTHPIPQDGTLVYG
jgi:hypothetical protein